MIINQNIPQVFVWTVKLTLCFFVFALPSCKKNPQSPGMEYMPDMYRAESYRTYSVNPNYPDSMTARLPVPGTIARGHMPYPFSNTIEGYAAADTQLINPIQPNKDNINAGKILYSKYCMHCHGTSGQGDGMVVTNGNHPPPPSYSTGKSSRGGLMKDLSAGKIYHTIMYGLNTMGSHASQLTVDERWKIVLYVQQLQKGSDADVSADAASDSTGNKPELLTDSLKTD